MRSASTIRVLLALTLVCSGTVHGAISPGDGAAGDPPGEMFLTVWDATNQVTYTRDLGLSIVDFLSNPTMQITRAPDALYTSTFDGVDPSALVYSIGAFNARFDDFPCCYGMVISSNSSPDQVFLPDFTALFSSLSTGGFYVEGANANDGGDANDYGADRSSLSIPGDPGYWGSEYWNGNIGLTVPFGTDAAVGTSLAFYALLLDEDGIAINTIALENVWTLAANGTLTFSGITAPVPAPAALWLLMSALAGAYGVSRRRHC